MREHTSLREPNTAAVREFRKALLRWYEKNKRDLPWRKDGDAYRVWVSEIMLQQTRVTAVVGYYQRFLKRFPDVGALARARESSVLAAWSGLGYYRRARGLHAAAKVIVNEMEGVFPNTAREWERLPGVGRYTAAAVASIAFGEACAVVDGNVERVLGRLTGKPEMRGDRVWQRAAELLDPRHPGDFNQAMMELGATVCVPAEPLCGACVVAQWCATRGRSAQSEKQPRKRRELAYKLSVREGAVWLVRRPVDSSLMAGMWELPSAPDGDGPGSAFTVRHSITDTDYRVSVWPGEVGEGAQGRWVQLKRLESVALTGLARKILRRAGVI